MNAVVALQPESESDPASIVNVTLNGRKLTARKTDTLIEIADREGVEIPRLCYMKGMEAVGNCRSCMVEVKGERVLAPACCRVPLEGMEVTTDSERALKSQHGALCELRADSLALYTMAIQLDDKFLTFVREGPVYTAASGTYEPPEGDYQDATNTYTERR